LSFALSSPAFAGALHCFIPELEPGFAVDIQDETPGPGFSAGTVTISYWYLGREDHYENVVFVPHNDVGTIVANNADVSETLVITILPFESGENYPFPGTIHRIYEQE